MTTHQRTAPGNGVPPFALISDGDRARLPGDVVDAYPLTRAQAALLTNGSPPQGSRIAARRIGPPAPFSPDALETAAADLARVHEVLRSSLDPVSCSEPLQRAHAEAQVPLLLHDHRGLDARTTAERLAALLDAERGKPFDTATPPPLRLTAVREPDEAWVLVVALDRVLAETVGADAVLAELLAGYRRALLDPGPAGRRPVVRHGLCAAAERDGLLDRAGRRHWRELTEHNAPFTLPRAWAPAPDGQRRPQEPTVPFDDLGDGLEALAAGTGVPLRTVLLAAHVKVLSTLTAEPAFRTDVVARPPGTPDDDAVACDTRLHRVVLPFAVDREASTWRDLVARVGERERQGWHHRYVPRPGADHADEGPGRLAHALFEAHDPRETAGPGRVEYVAGAQDTSGYGLHVLARDGHLLLRTAPGAIAPARVDGLARMYRTVLEAMAAAPDGDAHAACLAPEEREAVLRTWSAGPSADRGTVTVVGLLQDQAAATPDAVAVRTGEGTLTYRELDERSNRIAHHLVSLGARADTLVGVSLRRTPDLLPALIGVWKAGAGYLPLDPDLPLERTRGMLAATGCSLVVTTSEHRPVLEPLHEGTLVLLDEERDAVAARPATPTGIRVAPSHLAYVIYTSGSTGAPKGVMIEHGGLVNYLLWTLDAYVAHGSGGAPVFSSISFDLGIPNLFAPLLAGQPVHLLPEPFDAADLGRHLAAGAPYSFVKMTPGHLDLLTHQLTAEQIRSLAGIVIAAGDSFSAALAARWSELAGPTGTRVATEYGPTEITIGNSGQPVTDLPTTELIPLGTPIPNTTMYVLTDRLEPVPIGVPGEVYIGGAGVARGYLGRPDLTAERFVRDPYGTDRRARLYRTGDLARWLPDGTLDFLGRIDNQVKIRGYRVELGEIEANIALHPGVRDAVVVPREPSPGLVRLVAYVVPAVKGPVDGAGLRDRLAAVLPDYMIPADFVAIDRIPLTTNGKVDSRALPPVS
ncbi:amino acid adenylation domain-containing protein [Streptomyces sp. NPDC001678]|uniref:non-ribosomal peptide synthetase n=1 Tax=Streptomyces sp. NPDC001678 TaxID=3364599 RepID=UPI003680925D